MSTNLKNRQVYLDYAAATPVRVEVARLTNQLSSKYFANPASLHHLGVEAADILKQARQDIAQVLQVRPEEMIFTAGGSESVNLAVLGAARAFRRHRPKGGHIISSPIEHQAELAVLEELKAEGFAVSFLPVSVQGVVQLQALSDLIRKDTFLVSVMYANNEVGSVQPIHELTRLVRRENQKRRASLQQQSKLPYIICHTDACQAAGSLDIRPLSLGVDMLSLNASKVYGPRQMGCLFRRKGVEIEPLVFGGGQEMGLRSGTENVVGAAGFALALKLAEKERAGEVRRLTALRNRLWQGIQRLVPDVLCNGPDIAFPKQSPFQAAVTGGRLPGNLNLSILGVEGETLLLYLDAKGVYIATGSACTTTDESVSHVLTAMGLPKVRSKSAVRMSLGKFTTMADVKYVLSVMAGAVSLARQSHI